MKKNRTVLHLCIAAILFFLIKLLFPVVNGITPIGVSVIALFFSIVYLWTFEGVGWVSLLAIALFPCTGVMSYSEIAANSFGSWVTVFTLASCILNHALSESGMTDRIVKWAITRPAVQHHPWRFLCALFLSVYLVCLILDCTPAALVFFPMTLAICEQIGCEKQEKLSKVIFAGVMLSILLGYCATPISHSIPILFIGLINADFGIGMNFADWCKIGIPSSLVMFLLLLLFFRVVIRPDVRKLENFDAEAVLAAMPPMTRKQKIISATYGVVILLWLCPTILQSIAPTAAAWITAAGYIFPVVAAIAFLLCVQDQGKPVLDFDAALHSVSWPLILLTAGIMLVNPCISSERSGIIPFLSSTLGPLFSSASSKWVLIALAAAWVMVQTNFMSCFVSGQLVYTVFTPLAIALPAFGLNGPALGVMIAYACGVAFLSPPSSGPAAVFISTDYCTPGDALKYGTPLMIVYILLSVVVLYPLGAAWL